MKRYIKYLTIAFVLLMGYSQIFTYVFLGVISTPSARIADGIIRIHAPLNNASLFDSAIIEEMDEENKDDREALQINSNDFASLVSSIRRVEPLTARTYRFSPFQYLSLSTDSYLRYRVFRV